MAEPPKTPPSSDIQGVNRDARVGAPSSDHPDPGGAVQGAHEGSAARPDETPPSEDGAGEGRGD